MLLVGSGTALASDFFSDVDNDHPFHDEISRLFEEGISTGFPVAGDDPEFRPSLEITRQAVAAFLYRMAGEPEGPFTEDFSDVNPGHPFYDEIAWAAENGIVEGFVDGEFKPGLNITRMAFAAFLHGLNGAPDGPFAEDFPDVPDDHPFHTEIAWAAQNGIVNGYTDGEFKPSLTITRQAVAAMIARFIDGGFAILPASPTTPNQTFTDNPELLQVTRSGDIVTFHFDQNVPGKSLDFFNTGGTAGSLAAGDEVAYYTGPRLYDVAGTAHYPFEAGIFGDEVRARFVSASVVAGAVRAGVYEDTVQNAVGRGNPASDFPLAATAVQPDPIDPYFPQLTFAGNLRDTNVTPAEILVDFQLTFETTADAEAAQAAISPNLGELVADDFALVGSAGQVFRAVDVEGTSQSGDDVTVTVVMDPAIEDVPVSQLRRGFIEEDTFVTATIMLPHILLSTAYESIADVNGVTTDPDLVAVERGPGANQLRYVFDEAVSVPDGINDRPDLYQVVNNAEERATPTSIGRSLIAADNAEVMIATFQTGDVPGTYATVEDYLDTVTAAAVNTEWLTVDRTDVAASAARGTDQVGSQQLGWSTPAQVLVTPVQPPVVDDPVPGQTALPDLVSVTKSQNEITGNWQVTFSFDGDAAAAGTLVDYSLYDADGVRFSATSRDTPFATSITFGPDVGDATFSNEQIAAAVLGTVQDADADLTGVGSFGTQEPRVTEGHDGL